MDATADGFHELVRSQLVPLELDETFAFFSDVANLGAITPPWLHFRVLTPDVALGPGALIDYRLRVRFVPVRWRTRIEVWDSSLWWNSLQAGANFSRYMPALLHYTP